MSEKILKLCATQGTAFELNRQWLSSIIRNRLNSLVQQFLRLSKNLASGKLHSL